MTNAQFKLENEKLQEEKLELIKKNEKLSLIFEKQEKIIASLEEETSELKQAIASSIINFDNTYEASEKLTKMLLNIPISKGSVIVKQIFANYHKTLKAKVSRQKNDYEFNNRQLQSLTLIGEDVANDNVVFEPLK